MATSERLASYDFQKYDNFIQLTLNPPLSDAPWGDIDDLGKNVLNELETARTPSVLVDLSPLTYMGSAVVALLVRIWKATKGKSGEMVVLCSHPMVLKVISLAGLDKVWRITPNVETAYKELKVKPPSATATKANSFSSGVSPGPVVVGSNRSGVTINPLYNAQGALVIGKESSANGKHVVEVDQDQDDEENDNTTIFAAVLITVAVLSLILGGVGLAAMFKLSSIPKSVSLTLAFAGSGVAAISAIAAMTTGKATARIIAAICLLVSVIEMSVAFLYR
ncbi:STAS domain-containing protein [Lacunimicrobium album]